MNPCMPNPVFTVANAGSALMSLGRALAAARTGNFPPKLARLTHVRTSQINGCTYCVSFHSHEARAGGESEKRLCAVAARRHSRSFTPAEKMALELTEAITTIGQGDMVSEDLRTVAGQHFSNDELAALILEIATTNLWNRLNASTHHQFEATVTG